MDETNSGENDHLVDLESGRNAVIDELGGVREESGSNSSDLKRVWSGFVGIDGLMKGDGAGTGKLDHSTSTPCFMELPVINVEASPDKKSGEEDEAALLEKKPGAKKPKKKSCKKPPRPPRTSKSLPLDAADQKLIKELSELAMLKRARIERMKKKLKSTKSAASNGNLLAWIITVIFCLVVLWEGFSPQGASSVGSHGSPESSIQKGGGLITIQIHNNMSRYAPQSSHSASANIVETASLLDNMHGRKLGRRIRRH